MGKVLTRMMGDLGRGAMQYAGLGGRGLSKEDMEGQGAQATWSVVASCMASSCPG